MEQNELVRQALDKVLESPGFAQAPQLGNFLDYIVRKTLAGKAHELKGYTIGVEALGRREDFDPQTDTAVRVLAGRLRKALDNYYGEAGEKQPVHISIPKGSYVPVFSFLDDAADDKETSERTTGATPAVHDRATQTAARSNESAPRRTFLLAIAGLLLAVAFIGYWASYVKDHDHEPAQETLTVEESQLPSISISVHIADGSMPQWFSREEVTAGTIAAFSRFKDFRIYAVENARQAVGTDGSLADYHFSILVSRAGTSDDLYVGLTLTRQADRAVLWSGNKLLDERDPAVGIDVPSAAGEIIAPLLSPFGLIFGNIATWEALPPRLQCIKLVYLYFSGKGADAYTKARHCLEATVRSGSAPSSIHARLAYLYVEGHRRQYPGVSERTIAMANQAARKAIELDPENARAHQVMFAVHSVSGRQKKALESASKAVALNPFDSAIAGTFATYLVSIGKLEEAGPALANAFRLNPSQLFQVEIAAYLQADLSGNFVEADQLAASIDPDRSPMAAMVIALCGVRNKDSEKTDRALDALARMEPDFIADPATALLRRGYDAGIAETIAARLVTASADTE